MDFCRTLVGRGVGSGVPENDISKLDCWLIHVEKGHLDYSSLANVCVLFFSGGWLDERTTVRVRYERTNVLDGVEGPVEGS